MDVILVVCLFVCVHADKHPPRLYLKGTESEGTEGLGTASVLAESKVLDPEGGVEEELLAVAGLIRCDLGGCLFLCVHTSPKVCTCRQTPNEIASERNGK